MKVEKKGLWALGQLVDPPGREVVDLGRRGEEIGVKILVETLAESELLVDVRIGHDGAARVALGGEDLGKGEVRFVEHTLAVPLRKGVDHAV